MIYQSTRDHRLAASSTRAVLDGIAADGGLYMLDHIAALDFDWRNLLEMDTLSMSAAILSTLLPEFADMPALVKSGYEGKFETSELTPTVNVGDRHVLELFRGPTSAFKDVALSLLPRLITAARDAEGMEGEIVILTATSGDTGKAALEGFHDVPGTRIIVFYPHGGVSPVQQAQMTTQVGGNVCVCAVRGNFDDAQTGVKEIFAACAGRDLGGARLSSANSINIGRLVPQIVYYFKAYADLVKAERIKAGQPVHFVVPTGNFGDILAGYYAMRMGLPIHRLICASNQNCVLADFFDSGTYDADREFFKTDSPSMDILISSNLERLLYEYADRNADKVKEWMKQLNEDTVFSIGVKRSKELKKIFWADYADDEMTAAEIRRVFDRNEYLMDPHTAVASHVLQQYRMKTGDQTTAVIVSTASPYKFAPDVAAALLGADAVEDLDFFACAKRLEKLSGVAIPKQIHELRELPVRHNATCAPDAMEAAVMDALK